jgi:4-hydroxy-4-methyl-2-oxoglutarate aldolase
MTTTLDFSALTAAMVADVLDLLGLESAPLHPRPAGLMAGMRAAGPAATIAFVPEDGPAAADGSWFDDACTFIDGVAPGSVIVVDGPPAFAVWGELFTAACVGRGVQGVVCGGAVRDTVRCLPLGLPIFSVARDPRNCRGRLRVASTHAPVDVLGVRIAPGDVVVADDDGTVRIPAGREADVLQGRRSAHGARGRHPGRAARRRFPAGDGVAAPLAVGASGRTAVPPMMRAANCSPISSAVARPPVRYHWCIQLTMPRIP